MHCPHCDHPTTSVLSPEDGTRRRQCPQCFRRFNTREVLADAAKAIDKTLKLLRELGQVLDRHYLNDVEAGEAAQIKDHPMTDQTAEQLAEQYAGKQFVHDCPQRRTAAFDFRAGYMARDKTT
jgi:transcriptional regulator NrdR family protein